MIGNTSFSLMKAQYRKTAMLQEFEFFGIEIRGKSMLHGMYEQKQEMEAFHR